MIRRTKAQVEANKIDLDLFRVADALECFARDHKAPRLFESARSVRSARVAIRAQMHHEDVRATS